MRRRTLFVPCFTVALVAVAGFQGSAAAHPVVRTIPVGAGPLAIDISSTRHEAYVANAGSVSVIDLSTNTTTSTTGTGVGVQQTAIGAFGSKVYVGDFSLPVMSIFNPNTLNVNPNLSVGEGVTTIAHARAGFAYIGFSRKGGMQGFIKVMNTKTNKVVKTVALDSGVGCATVTPRNHRYLWVGSNSSGRLRVIDTRTNRVVRRLFPAFKVGPVQGLDFSPNGKRVWVFGLGGISVVSRASGRQLHFIPITNLFHGMFQAGPIAFNASGTRVLAVNSAGVNNPQRGSIAVINPSTYRVTERILLGHEPFAMALDQANGTTYAANFGDGTVSYFKTPR